MAVKKWIGPGKTSTGANWEGGTIPALTSDVQFVAEKNNAAELNQTAGKGRSYEFGAGYTAAVTSTAGAVVKLGTTTGIGTALKILEETKWEVSTSMTLEFVSEVAEIQKIFTAGKKMPTMMFIGEKGKWKLEDALLFEGANLSLVRGELDTNSKTIEAKKAFEITGNEARVLKLGASVVKLTAAWDAGTTTNLTFEEGTSTFELVGVAAAQEFKGGGLKYNNLTDAHIGETKITGANTFATLAINNKEATAKKGCKFQVGVAQTMTALTTNGAAGKLARIESTVEKEKHKLKKAAGTVELKYTYIQDSEAEGGATWIAGEGCVDGGENVGWIFEGAVTTIAGVAKIKIKQASATEVLYAAVGATKVTIQTKNATTPTYSVQSAAKVRFATAGALSTTVLLAGTTKVTFTDSLFIKVTKEGEEGRKVVFLIVDE